MADSTPPTFSVRSPDSGDEVRQPLPTIRSRYVARAAFDLATMLFVMVGVTVILWGPEHLLTSWSLRLGIVIAALVVAVVGWEGLYDRAEARTWLGAVTVVIRALAIGAGVFSLTGFVVAIGGGARRWLLLVLLGWGVALCLHHGVRAAHRTARIRVVVAGTAIEAVSMRTALRRDRRHAYDVVGFVLERLDDTTPKIVADMALGALDDLPLLIDRYEVDQVVFCMGGLRGDKFAPLARLLNRRGIDVSLTGLGEVSARRVAISRVQGRPVIAISPAVRAGWRVLVKRLVDVVVAAVVLLVASPLLIAISLSIRLADRSSPIFAQRRVGRGGEIFTIYKFRTMVAGADATELDLTNDHDGPVFKMHGDPRVTRVGGILRRTSLDELPQLWNVLRGDMSLVGPRPLIESEVAAAPASFRDRELVTPGMTGRWQVSGRSDTDFDELDELDRWYVDNWSLGQDLQILARTVPAVLLQRGAR